MTNTNHDIGNDPMHDQAGVAWEALAESLAAFLAPVTHPMSETRDDLAFRTAAKVA